MTAVATNVAYPDRADQLGTALQQGLPRPIHPKLSWTLLRTLVLGGISGGLIPAIVLPGRFNDFIRSEQMNYWHLGEWVRLQSGGVDGDAPTRAAEKLKPSLWMPILARLFAIVAIGIAWTAVHDRVHEREAEVTRVQPEMRHEPRRHRQSDDYEFFGGLRILHGQPGPPHVSLWTAWTALIWPSFNRGGYEAAPSLITAFDLAIAGACLCWLIQINGHVGRARAFVASFNRVANHFGVGPVREPGWHLGLRPVWLVAAIIMCCTGGIWIVPVMLAGAAQRSYTIRTTRRLRMDLARRQRDLLLASRPPRRVAASPYLLDRCPQPNCRAPLPPEATFCRRCGTKLTADAANARAGAI